MLNNLLGKLTYDIGIDLGTANTLVYVKGKGIVIREPSVLAVHKKTKQVLAVGEEAKRMLGKTPPSILAVRPLRAGVISDFYVAEQMLAYFMHLIHKIPSKFPKVPRPRVVVGVPCAITSVERKAVIDAAKRAGAREAYLVEEPVAAAVGAGLPIEEPRGNLIIDMGGGTTEIAVISLGGVVVSRSLRVAGDRLDAELVNYAREKHNLLLGERTAERIKCEYGSALEFTGESGVRVPLGGRDLKTGLPRSIEITTAELRSAFKPSLTEILEAIKDTIEATPPELMPDILHGGLVLAGGTSLLKNFAKLISLEIKVPVFIAEDPMTCIVRGCAKLLDKPELLAKVKL